MCLKEFSEYTKSTEMCRCYSLTSDAECSIIPSNRKKERERERKKCEEDLHRAAFLSNCLFS